MWIRLIDNKIAEIQSNPPWDAVWVADEIKNQFYSNGWKEIDQYHLSQYEMYVRPISPQEKMKQINDEYNEKINKIISGIQTANANGKPIAIAQDKLSQTQKEWKAALIEVAKKKQ